MTLACDVKEKSPLNIIQGNTVYVFSPTFLSKMDSPLGLALSVRPERYLLYKLVSFVEHLLGQHGFSLTSHFGLALSF